MAPPHMANFAATGEGGWKIKGGRGWLIMHLLLVVEGSTMLSSM